MVILAYLRKKGPVPQEQTGRGDRVFTQGCLLQLVFSNLL